MSLDYVSCYCPDWIVVTIPLRLLSVPVGWLHALIGPFFFFKSTNVDVFFQIDRHNSFKLRDDLQLRKNIIVGNS